MTLLETVKVVDKTKQNLKQILSDTKASYFMSYSIDKCVLTCPATHLVNMLITKYAETLLLCCSVMYKPDYTPAVIIK